MAFDTAGAKAAGYSDAEIADFMGQGSNFDVAGARQAGYNDGEIMQYLDGNTAPQAAPPVPNFGSQARGQSTAGDKPSALKQGISSLAHSALPILGLVGGGLVAGAAATPETFGLGTIPAAAAGGGLGYAAGNRLATGLDQAMGIGTPETMSQALHNTAKDTAVGTAYGAIGPGLSAGGSLFSQVGKNALVGGLGNAAGGIVQGAVDNNPASLLDTAKNAGAGALMGAGGTIAGAAISKGLDTAGIARKATKDLGVWPGIKAATAEFIPDLSKYADRTARKVIKPSLAQDMVKQDRGLPADSKDITLTPSEAAEYNSRADRALRAIVQEKASPVGPEGAAKMNKLRHSTWQKIDSIISQGAKKGDTVDNNKIIDAMSKAGAEKAAAMTDHESAFSTVQSVIDSMTQKGERIPVDLAHQMKMNGQYSADYGKYNPDVMNAMEKAKADEINRQLRDKYPAYRGLNAQYRQYADAQGFLEKASGRLANNDGSMGKFLNRATGGAIGGFMGTLGGPAGTGAGALIGSEAMSAINSPTGRMARAFLAQGITDLGKNNRYTPRVGVNPNAERNIRKAWGGDPSGPLPPRMALPAPAPPPKAPPLQIGQDMGFDLQGAPYGPASAAGTELPAPGARPGLPAPNFPKLIKGPDDVYRLPAPPTDFQMVNPPAPAWPKLGPLYKGMDPATASRASEVSGKLSGKKAPRSNPPF